MRYGLILLWMVGCGAPVANEVEVAFPEGQSQLAVRGDAIVWGKCPPTLPSSCEMAVLEGNPREAQLFTVRFRISEPLEMQPHWHPRNERVTILDGKVGVGFGDDIDQDAIIWFEPGDYYVNLKGAHHFVVVDGPALLQITGIGPWEVNFLEPS